MSNVTFLDYCTYRAKLAVQGVRCIPSFESWADSMNQHRNGWECIYQVTSQNAVLPLGWYKNVFAPNEHEPNIYGPYPTRAAAVAA
jgi:hypothetical protein